MHVAAVDLGASSGRVMLADVGTDRLALQEIHRFPNVPVTVDHTLYWDVLGLYGGMQEGLRRVHGLVGELAGIGVDAWAVDYGLLDSDGRLIDNPVHYRDSRTANALDMVHRVIGRDELYRTTGVQELSFNTLVQLACERGTARLARAQRLLLVPDLLTYWMSGQVGAERTNASTTQLYDATRRCWEPSFLTRLGVPFELLAPLVDPGTVIGPVTRDFAGLIGGSERTQVVAVGSHDTASAVAGTPLGNPRTAAFISSGTWSLVGVELAEPVLTDAARTANFTNEAGVDGTVRFLRNVMGLWIIQESLRTWKLAGRPQDLRRLIHEAARLPRLTWVIDPDDASLLPPGDQPSRIARLCEQTGQRPPTEPAQVVRTILDSLALAYRRAVRLAQAVTGVDVQTVHVVGGGANNALLCQLTADACGVPVLAGPVEAAAIGNALVQARALGGLSGDLSALRQLVSRTQQVVRYEPQGVQAEWDAAQGRLDRRTSQPATA
ncbi:rhamnulokinase [Angustibacter sp. McL0619]|uniref:rhamnulokinase n=1 Tax=Angustibacter sp. McL0619 TaxID=3415676 RepID=UPI003CF8F963